MGFVFIGTSPKIEKEGSLPYLRAIQYKKGMRIERIYIAARDWAVDTAKKTSCLAEKRGFGKMVKKPMQYRATDTEGQRREQVLIEMQLTATSPLAPPEQGKLLEE